MPPKAHPRRQPSRRGINNEASDGPPEPLSPGRTSTGPPETAESAGFAEHTPNPNSTTDRTPRPQVQRLASLNNPRRGPEQPITLSSPDVAAKRLKFQPKSAVRRSKEEREATERAEAERLQARLAASDLSSGFVSGRGGSRGRGDRRSDASSLRWQGERYAGSGASGFLGGATPAEDKRQREALLTRSRGRGGGGGGRPSMLSEESREATKPETSTAVKKESNTRSGKAKDKDGDTVMHDSGKRRSTRVKKEKGESFVREESDDELFELGPSGKRINIENINLISDEDSSDEVIDTSGKGAETERSRTPRVLGSSSMRPIRIDRHEHVERTIGVNTDASSLTSAELRRQAKARGEAQGSLFLPDNSDPINDDARKPKGRKKGRDVEFLRDERKWQGVYQDEEDDDMPVRIKEEQNDAMIIDDDDHHEMEIEGTAITQGMLDERQQASIPKSNATPDHPQTPIESPSPNPRLKRNTGRQGPRFLTCRKPIPKPSTDENKKGLEPRHHHHHHDNDNLPIPHKHLRSFTLLQKTPPPPPLHHPPIQHNKNKNEKKKTKKEKNDLDSNAAAELKKTRLADRKSGAVYLFQLPPLLPAATAHPSDASEHPSKKPPEEEEGDEKKNKPSDPPPQPQPPPPPNNTTDTKPQHALPPPTSTPTSTSTSSSTSQQGILGHINIPEPRTGGGRIPTATWSNALKMDLGRATDYAAGSEVVMFNGGGGGKEAGTGGKAGGERAQVGDDAYAVGGMGGGVCVVPDWGWLFGG
ncbi:MAG: hypothetical protein LQ350_006366 [Teloschistes chrysophthalmus]|nr:MAG: hypothetical protein LQ350_006366 [Niorma chrysophthalma]